MIASRQQKLAFSVAMVVVAVLAIGGYLSYAPRGVPEGQPALVRLDAGSIETLRADFNAGAGGTRLLVLLSPT